MTADWATSWVACPHTRSSDEEQPQCQFMQQGPMPDPAIPQGRETLSSLPGHTSKARPSSYAKRKASSSSSPLAGLYCQLRQRQAVMLGFEPESYEHLEQAAGDREGQVNHRSLIWESNIMK